GRRAARDNRRPALPVMTARAPSRHHDSRVSQTTPPAEVVSLTDRDTKSARSHITAGTQLNDVDRLVTGARRAGLMSVLSGATAHRVIRGTAPRCKEYGTL